MINIETLPGRPFRGVFTSADASSPSNAPATVFTLYEVKGATTITLAATDEVIITDIIATVGANISTTIFEGADENIASPSEIIAVVRGGTTVCATHRFAVPHFCAAGVTPRCRTSGTGQVDCVIHGVIRKVTDPINPWRW